MSEDAKKILDSEKMSEDELDNVAGGTMDQTAELINALSQIDPQGVSDMLNKAAGASREELANDVIHRGVQDLLGEHFGLIVSTPFDGRENTYNTRPSTGFKTVSHEQVLNMIKAKAQGWEFN